MSAPARLPEGRARVPLGGTRKAEGAPVSPVRLGSVGLMSLLLAACAATPPAAPPSADPPQDPPPAPVVVLPAEPTAYELRQKERAQALSRQGRLADAALVWELLATIRPTVAEYRERLNELQRQITAAVADRQQRGEQALARGQLDAATQQFLAALALQPDNQRVAEALRGVERERVKRTHLGKLSRNTLTRRAISEAEMAATDGNMAAAESLAANPGAAAGIPDERNEVEHASLLAGQGEWDEAIAMLERHLRTNRRDEAARELLADVYFQKAESLAVRNRTAALALLERSVRTNPRHPRAPEKLRQLRTATTPTTATPSSAAAAASATTNSLIKPAAATISTPAASPPQPSPRR